MNTSRNTQLVLALVLLAAGVGPFPGRAEAVDVPVGLLDAFATIQYQVEIGRIMPNATLDTAAPTRQPDGTFISCGSTASHYTPSPTDQQFAFHETAQETGCAEYGYLFRPPVDARDLTLEFETDRTIEQPAELPIDAPQLVRAYDAAKKVFATINVFDSTDSAKPRSRFSYEFNLPQPSSEVNITWYFEDKSYTAGVALTSVGTQQAFSASVFDPWLKIAQYPLFLGAPLYENESAQNGRITNTTLRPVTVPDLLQGANDTISVTLRVSPGTNVAYVATPTGAKLNATQLRSQSTRTHDEFQIPPELLAAGGPGQYVVVLTSSRPIPPPPPPLPPTTIYPVIVGLLALPGLPGALALRTGFGYAREAQGRFRLTARSLLLGILGGLALYLALVVFVLMSSRLSTLATLPFTGEAWFFNLQLVLFAIVFVAFWIIPGRYLLQSMRADVEQRKRIQQELQRSNQELEHFAYVASHDLQEPLRTISGYTQLLQRRYGKQLDENAHRYIETAVAGTQRLSRLINDLLAYSRVQTRGASFEVADTAQVFDQAVSELQTLVQERRAKVKRGPLPTIKCDSVQLRQVFSNLVQNAIKYSDPKRIPEVRATAVREDGAWRFSVRDNGIGIEREYFDKIFIIFQRLQPRGKPDDGTGLGLAIARRIVERHGGRIWVESKFGQGSTFHFTMPESTMPGMK